MSKTKSSIGLIKKTAESLGFSANYLYAPGVPKRLLITNGKKVCIVNSSIFGFYPNTLRWQQHLFDSKLLTQDLVTRLGYNTIPTIAVYHKKFTSFQKLFTQVSKKMKKYPVVIKPEKGFYGKDISIIENESSLKKVLRHHYSQKNNVLIQKILKHEEYRILLVNSQVEAIHIKQLHCVTGDGTKTLGELLDEKSSREKDSLFIKQKMKARGLSNESILPKDNTFPYHLTRFSSPGEFYETENFPKAAAKWAKKLSRSISTETIGIDVFAPHGLSDPDSFIIIELNANPAFDYIKKRYKDEETMTRIIKNSLNHYFKK